MDNAHHIIALRDNGFCVLRNHFSSDTINACRDAFAPTMQAYLDSHADRPNRGARRHFIAMPFEPPCYASQFFFDADVLSIVRSTMDERVVADQWGCDIPMRDSEFQGVHADYQRPLFAELPELSLPPHMIVVSFGLVPITADNGPLEIAPGTHRMARTDAMRSVESGDIALQPVTLDIGDVLIRHPWALHRGTPNNTDVPRPLCTIRYVRRWYADVSRDVNEIPRAVWASLSNEQREIMRFPVAC